MIENKEKGFSLIELLLVVVIIGIIAAIAVPAYQKANRSAENGSTFATMRTMSSGQVACYSQKGRFCRLEELNSMQGDGLGTVVLPRLVRGKFTFEMGDVTPSDEDLKNTYSITALKSVYGDENVYKFEMDQTGRVWQILPVVIP